MREKLESSDNLLRDAMRIAVPVEEPGKVEQRREKLLRKIESQILLAPERAKKSESRRRWGQGLKWGSIAAALCLAVGAGMWLQAQHQGDAPSVAQKKLEGAGGPARLAQSGEHLATERGERQALKLPGDTLVSVGERTGLRLLEALPERQVLELDYGRVDLEVTPKKEGPARYVSVKTPHALVLVKGTAFSVDVKAASVAPEALSTKVAVTRGVVLVRHAGGELTLKAGESWSSGMRWSAESRVKDAENEATAGRRGQSSASALKSAASAEQPGPAAAVEGASDEGASDEGAAQAVVEKAKQPASAEAPVPGSTLAEENALFERAIAAAQNGKRERALILLDDFLVRYPRSPLRDAVRAKKSRLLSE